MNRAFHPTHIRMKEDHCGYAVELSLINAKRDTSVFQTGVAAHAILENIGKETNKNPDITKEEIEQIANITAYNLTVKGRSYDGNPEPPMTMKQALDGMQLALKYVERNPLPADALYEKHFAFDESWNLVEYDSPEAEFRTMIDYVRIYTEIDEDGEEALVAEVRDFKTQWNISTDMLDNLQRRAQGLVVALAFPKIDVLKLQVHGLRGNQRIERIIYLNFERVTIQNWKDDIAFAINVLKAPQEPSPGLGCYSCPYAVTCRYNDPEDLHSIAKQYAIHHGKAKELEKKLKAITKENPILDERFEIGYKPKKRNTTVPKAMTNLFNIWKENDGTIDAYLNLCNLTATEAKKIMTQLRKNGIDTKPIEETIFNVKEYSQFGISKKDITS